MLSNARGLGLIPGQGNRYHMLQLTAGMLQLKSSSAKHIKKYWKKKKERKCSSILWKLLLKHLMKPVFWQPACYRLSCSAIPPPRQSRMHNVTTANASLRTAVGTARSSRMANRTQEPCLNLSLITHMLHRILETHLWLLARIPKWSQSPVGRLSLALRTDIWASFGTMCTWTIICDARPMKSTWPRPELTVRFLPLASPLNLSLSLWNTHCLSCLNILSAGR